MIDTTKIFKNFSYLTVASILCRIIGIILYIVLARYLGPRNYGIYAIALSYMNIFVLLANFGLDTVYIRDVSRKIETADSYFYSCMALKFILSILCMLLLAGIIHLLDYSRLTQIAIIVFSFSIFLQASVELLSSLFKAYEAMQYSSMILLFRSVISLLIALILIYLGQGILVIIIGQGASFLIVGLIFYIVGLNKGFIKRQCRLDIKLVTTIIKSALPFVTIGIVHIVNLRIDILAISYFLSEKAVGLYGVASELILSLLIIPGMLSTALFPALSKKFKESNSLAPISNLSIKGLITLGVPMGAGILMLSPAIIAIFFGDKYAESASVLAILSLGLGLTYARLVFSWLLTAVNLAKYALLEYIYCLIINLSLNVLLIPHFGIQGAAIATVASSIFGNLYLYYQVKRILPQIKFVVNYYKPILGAVVMGICLKSLPSINLGIDILIGMFVYSMMVILLKMFSNQDYSLLSGKYVFIR